MTKTIGLIRSKNDKKVFFLPSDVKKLTGHGYQVFCHSGYGKYVNVSDQEYVSSGVKVVDSAQEVLANSTIILLTSNIKGLNKKQFQNKIVISLANLFNNLDMVECFIRQKVIAIQWLLSSVEKQFDLFNKLEKIKNNYVFELLKCSKKPIKNIALIHGTSACLDLVKKLLNQKYNVKLFSLEKCIELKQQVMYDKQSNFDVYHIDPETFNDDIQSVDCIINMNQNPEMINWKLFTNELIKLVSKRTMLIDLGSENGLCGTFMHRYTKPYHFKRYHNILFSAQYDITNNYAIETSKCISNHSIDMFLEMLQKDNFDHNPLLITKNNEIVNPLLLAKLHI